MSDTKNDTAWEDLFGKYKIQEAIVNVGSFEITATQINKVREARLMTKFDHRSQLPGIFKNNQLSILPITRGSYVIAPFKTFYDFNKDDVAVNKVVFPHFLQSIDYRDINSEATSLNCAFVSNILHDFTDEESLFATVNGRMSSGQFNFDITTTTGWQKVNVNNSQLEIDGGYEGDQSLIIVEAKNYISDDFIIRQLFYPFRLWRTRVRKAVRPVFLTYSNGVFDLREYTFSDFQNYNSLSLVKHKRYALQEGTINTEAIQNILESIVIGAEPLIPFPQADSFERVINICELVKDRGSLSKEEITLNYDFDSRQTDYYINAAKYLGLATTKSANNQVICTLTEVGQKMFELSILERQLEYIRLILEHVVFNIVLKKTFENGAVPHKDEIVDIMKASNLYKVDSEVTFRRRASTVTAWVNWILKQIEE